MQIIKLPEPELRPRELRFERVSYLSNALQYLKIPDQLPDIGFFDVFERRRTSREFGYLSEYSLGLLLWAVAKTRLTFREPLGYVWQHRCPPSAGGRHPIDLLIIPPITGDARAYLYDPIGHALHDIPENDEAIRAFCMQLQDVVATGNGTVIWCVARYDRTLAKYKNPESLIWRDAGVLLGAIHFVAEALQLNCCAYGLTGDAWISKLFDEELTGGAGGCVVGSR